MISSKELYANKRDPKRIVKVVCLIILKWIKNLDEFVWKINSLIKNLYRSLIKN